MASKTDDCAICGVGRTRLKLRKAGSEILECTSCRCQFWLPPPGFRAEEIYGATYFEGARTLEGYDDYGSMEGPLRRTFRRRLKALGTPESEDGLLDIGAAYGYAVEEARRLGWRATGLEVSRAAAQRAAARGSRLVIGSAGALPFGDGEFAIVTLWDVLEHVSDPHRIVAEVARVLRPGGRLALTTGDVGSWFARLSGPRWHLYNLPEHLFFYSRRSLRFLLERHGFRLEEIRAEGGHYPLGYLAERLQKTILGRRGRAPAKWPGADLAVSVNLGDIVAVRAVRVARRRA